jgi:glycosyltransferase involved in cell wall biosynthesis
VLTEPKSEKESRRLRVIVTFPFQIYPVNSGGAMRGYFLLREMSRHFETIALVLNFPAEIKMAIDADLGDAPKGLTVLQIPGVAGTRSLLNRIKDRLTTSWNAGSLRVPTNAVVLNTSLLLDQVVSRTRPHVVVVTNLESWVSSGMLKRKHPAILRIIDMPNVEHVLYAQQLTAKRVDLLTNVEWNRLRREEGQLHRVCQGLFACSVEDSLLLSKLNEDQLSCTTVSNGVACEQSEFDTNPNKHEHRSLLFCGTLSYPPNIDGLNWFVKDILPLVLLRHPDVRLRVVGRNFNETRLPMLLDHPSIDVIGAVDSVKSEYLKTGVAICPLRMGSGTRLKILESMSFGSPTVSTTIGCEGIRAIDGETILIRDDAHSFADAVNLLLTSPVTFHKIRQKARSFVEANYDWKVIGDIAAKQIIDWHSAYHAVKL